MKTRAQLTIRLWVDCPHCKEQIDLMENSANEEGSVTDYIFEGWESWNNIGIEVECEHCKKQFIFDSIAW